MGIKFHCPNGHKLNVKAFLAGKKGVCPKCGTKVRIPEASEAGLEDSDAEESDVRSAVGSLPGNGAPVKVAATAPVVPALAKASPVPAALPSAQLATAAPVAVPLAPQGQMLAVPAGAVSAPLRPPAAGDPIAEAPMAIWYVRPPSGGQFGPARGDVMRKWIAEGRVSSDSLVWREGWTDWQNAGKLFPHLQAASAPATAAAATPGVTRAARTVNRYQAKKAGGSSLGVALLIFLGIVCLVLMAVLAYVLFNLK